MSSDNLDIRYVAKLARIALTDDEVQRFGAELSDLLTHVNAISQLDTARIDATAQVVTSRNVNRPDECGQCLPRDLVLAAAPQTEGPYLRVPRIIAEPQ